MEERELTPMMRQYGEIKARHRGELLFFRLGDFYELFEDDAREASALLGLTLTRRQATPMCGIPYHAANTYIGRLLAAGRKVAICDQVEDPAQAKGIVRREVTRVVTPGTLVDEKLLPSHDNNMLLAVAVGGRGAGADGSALAVAVAACDVSTGELYVAAERGTARHELDFVAEHLARWAPRELVVAEADREFAARAARGAACAPLVTALPDRHADPAAAEAAVKEHFQVAALDGLTLSRDDCSVVAVQLALAYLAETQRGSLAGVGRVTRVTHGRHVVLPGPTQAHLELVSNTQGGQEHTLFAALDETRTPMGLRCLKRSLLEPLAEAAAVNVRLDAVAAFVADRLFLAAVRGALGGIRDLERLASRLAMRRASPRDLVALRFSLEGVQELRRVLLEKPAFLEHWRAIPDGAAAAARVAAVLRDEPAVQPGEGGMVREGFSAEVDGLRALAVDGEAWLADYQQRERARTGIGSLKVKYNRLAGWFLEVSKTHLDSVPADFRHRQAIAGGARFVTDELAAWEGQARTARGRLVDLEDTIFAALVDEAQAWARPAQEAARAVALLDMLASFAQVARDREWVRPIVDDGDTIEIVDGRHPVVERALPPGERFVPNSTRLDLDGNRLLVVTGPNMAGKSTYLRQSALLVLLAQAGSFVPAASARVGVVDKIFTRVGASDNLARGQSTFLVEMMETATILNSATARSLLVMDEIGRGTSTYDGLAIAWAVIEYLLEHPARGGRTLFATHYHELTALGARHGVANLNVEVREWNDEVIFLKKVVPGAADKSYGIHVARLAGLPAPVIARARAILGGLEAQGDAPPGAAPPTPAAAAEGGDPQLPLFRAWEREVLERIRGLDLDRLSPLDALVLLAEFKERL